MPEQKLVGNFVALPEKTLQSKEWKAFTPSMRCIYWTMMTKYKRTGNQANGRVTWKQEELAKQAGVSLNTVKRSLRDLKDEEWISIWEPGGRWLDGTTYKMNPEWANG